MSDQTLIQWCDYTWSPWLGCRKVSPGCDNCYITSTTPFRVRQIKHGSQREELSEAYWKQPLKWNRLSSAQMIKPRDVTSGTYRKPRVFPSLCDPFDNEVQLAWKIRFWKLVWQTPNLDWLILTKRPQNWRLDWDRMIHLGVIAGGSDLPKNVWFGVSCEDQKRADERIPILLSIPARVRFLSVEPLLGPVDLTAVKQEVAPGFFGDCLRWYHRGRCHELDGVDYPTVNWVIFGGESGKQARPCNIDWIREGVRQCKDAGVAAFVKELGARPFTESRIRCEWEMKHPKGGDSAEWPEDLRVRQFPKT